MRVTNRMIDKELRTAGLLVKLINPTFTESRFKIINKLMNSFVRGTKDQSIQCLEDWITRRDGSRFRVCIYRPLATVEGVPGVLWMHGGGYGLGLPESSISGTPSMSVCQSTTLAPGLTSAEA